LYVGWTEPGEWLRYTIDVKHTGIYQIAAMYTANGDCQISFAINGEDKTGPLTLMSAADENDKVAWHHWNYMADVRQVYLQQGLNELQLNILAQGQANFDYFEFTPLSQTEISQ
jgi:hypothetical protein